MLFDSPGVQQSATNRLHVNATYRHSDENRINAGLCNGYAVIVQNRELSGSACYGLANRRLQPLGHLSTAPSETVRRPALKQIFRHIANFQLSTFNF